MSKRILFTACLFFGVVFVLALAPTFIDATHITSETIIPAIVVSVVPSSPDTDDDIDIEAWALDTGSGVVEINVWLFQSDPFLELDMKTCTYSPVAGSRTCTIDAGLLPADTYEMVMNATDHNGNFNVTPIFPVIDFVVSPGSPILSIPVLFIPFGDQDIDSGPKSNSVPLDNLGGTTLTGSVSGLAAPFACVSNCTYSIPPGGTVIVGLEFDPLTTGPFSDTANFSCSPGCTDVSRDVNGTGTGGGGPVIEVSWSPGGEPVNFGDVVADGSNFSEKTFSIRNVGAVGSSFSGSVSPTAPYSCIGGCTYTNVDEGEVAQTITIRFTPPSFSTFSQTLNFIGAGDQPVSITGKGVPAVSGCIDTDDGVNDPYSPGTCTDSDGPHFDGCSVEGPPGIVNEWECNAADTCVTVTTDCTVTDACPMPGAVCAIAGTPTGMVTINGGDASTGTSSVTLSIICTSGTCDLMRIANSVSDLDSAPSEGFAASRGWDLLSGNHSATSTMAVFIQFQILGEVDWSPQFVDTIEFTGGSAPCGDGFCKAGAETPLSCPADCTDADGDGMDDTWEEKFGGDLDPLGDPDGDGCNNLCEFLAGSNPLPGLPPSRVVGLESPIGAESFGELISNIIDFLFTFATILAPIILVISGIMFMTGGGNPGRIAMARRILLYSLVGFSIIIASKGLANLIESIL